MQNMNGKSVFGLDANVAAALCYLPFCAINLIMSIMVIVQDKTNKVARFHAFQSIFLMIASIILSVIMMILYFIAFGAALSGSSIGSIIGILVGLVLLVLGIASLGILVFLIIAAIKAFGGEIYKIPVIGNFAEKYSN